MSQRKELTRTLMMNSYKKDNFLLLLLMVEFLFVQVKHNQKKHSNQSMLQMMEYKTVLMMSIDRMHPIETMELGIVI